MPVSRMRMRPWLEKMIDSERVPGLQWVDKDKTMFSIPWKHAARHGWELEKDASLFKLWAIHTGKHVEGQSCDPKTWKANFRCAMNSLPDIEEVKDKSINKGHQAMRVFKLLPITPKSRDKRCRMGKLRKTQVKYEEDSSDSDSVPSPIELPQQSPQDNRVDRTMFTDSQDGRYPSPVEVPDWSSMVEIGSESYNHRFQVSPSHSMCDDPYTDKMIEICEELESERQWMNLGLENRGFLSNETCTSPGSQWSEGSSADELDELPRTEYTLLNTSYTATSAEHIWSNLLML